MSALRLLAFVLLLPTAAFAGSGGPIAFSLDPIYLNPDDPAQMRVGRLDYLAGYELSTEDVRFGGLSGLFIDDDGATFLAITDTGRWLSGQLSHDDEGRLNGLKDTQYGTMHAQDGRRLAPDGHKSQRDAEAITRARDGAFLVSFERNHRILRFAPTGDGIDGTPTALELPEVTSGLPNNGGIEAMTLLPDGRLLMLSEDLRDGDNVVGWIVDGAAVRRILLSATGIFQPTDLAALPNGEILLLERRFSAFGGAGGRVSRITLDQLDTDAPIVSEELAVLQPPMSVDNYESLAVTPASGGGWRLYLVSDDNFNPLQRTLFLQFHWDGR